MAMAALKIKIMPDSLEADLESIKEKIKEVVLKYPRVLINNIEEEPIAFGLKALIITLAWPEENDQADLEQKLSKIEHVESVQVIDFRRAFG